MTDSSEAYQTRSAPGRLLSGRRVASSPPNTSPSKKNAVLLGAVYRPRIKRRLTNDEFSVKAPPSGPVWHHAKGKQRREVGVGEAWSIVAQLRYIRVRLQQRLTLLPNVEGEPTDTPPTPSCENTAVTVTFQLTVEGEPPEDATFFGYLGYEPAPFQLTDPDGAGVYIGSTPEGLVPAGDTQPAFISQGTGTRESQVVGTSPGEPTCVLRNFGEVTFKEDATLPASVSFEAEGGPGAGFPGNVANGM